MLAGLHAADDLLFVVRELFFLGTLAGFLADAGGGKNSLHFDGPLPRLGTVSLIHDHGVAAVRKLSNVACDERELLQDITAKAALDFEKGVRSRQSL